MFGNLVHLVGVCLVVAMVGDAPEADVSDDDLTERIARRHESAGASFGRLHERHAPPLRAFLSARVPRDDLDDVEQVVWQRVWERLPDQYHGGNFRAWLLQIARRAAIDHGRKRRDKRLDAPEDVPDPGQGPPDAVLVEQQRSEALQQCLSRLESLAAALVKARLGGESYPELCARLGLTPARAHKLFHRAKEQLRRCVDGE
jgi:RNA polymerase sigma factor (sigma-70 family)